MKNLKHILDLVAGNNNQFLSITCISFKWLNAINVPKVTKLNQTSCVIYVVKYALYCTQSPIILVHVETNPNATC